MKMTISLLLISLAFTSYAQNDLSQEENKGIDELISQNVIKEYEQIKSKAVANLLTANFFYAKIENKLNSDGSYQEFKLMEVEGRMLEVNGIAKVMTVLKPDFAITNEQKALEFEKMLDALFPMFSPRGKQNYKKDNSWIFVREDSFGEKNGYVASLDEKGKIKSIEYTKIME